MARQKTKLKVAVIGVGGIAKTHIPGWRASEHAELVAGCDMNDQVLKEWGQKEGVTRLYSDPKDVFADKDIDIVDVCTPNNYHAPLSIAAMQAGKHVICEKPLAPTPALVRQMIAARDKSGKLLMTAQHMRFMGSSAALKAEVDTGVLGNVYHARSWMLRRAASPSRSSFTLKKHATGGPCIDIGVHILDLTLWLMGNPKPVAVSGVARTELAHQKGAFGIWGDVPREFDVEDFAAAFVRFENGATLILEVSWMLHHEVPDSTKADDMRMWLYGDKGGATWPECQILTTDNKRRQMYNRKLMLTSNAMPPHALECVAFARAIAEGEPAPVAPEQSLQVMTILDGVYRSQTERKEIRLD